MFDESALAVESDMVGNDRVGVLIGGFDEFKKACS